MPNKYTKHSKGKHLEIFKHEQLSQVELPFVNEGISAGFPSPAQDYLELSIDINKELIKNPSSTFLARVRGFSMQNECIDHEDILVIDKSLTPKDGDIIVAYIDGEFTLKTLKIKKDGVYLMPANDEFKPITVTEENNFIIWGVVTYSIRNQGLNKKHR